MQDALHTSHLLQIELCLLRTRQEARSVLGETGSDWVEMKQTWRSLQKVVREFKRSCCACAFANFICTSVTYQHVKIAYSECCLPSQWLNQVSFTCCCTVRYWYREPLRPESPRHARPFSATFVYFHFEIQTCLSLWSNMGWYSFLSFLKPSCSLCQLRSSHSILFTCGWWIVMASKSQIMSKVHWICPAAPWR